MYMLVEVETEGGTPRATIKGLKIDPPPKPSAPLVQPPNKANINSSLSYLLSYLISLASFLLNFYFKACSFMFI